MAKDMTGQRLGLNANNNAGSGASPSAKNASGQPGSNSSANTISAGNSANAGTGSGGLPSSNTGQDTESSASQEGDNHSSDGSGSESDGSLADAARSETNTGERDAKDLSMGGDVQGSSGGDDAPGSTSNNDGPPPGPPLSDYEADAENFNSPGEDSAANFGEAGASNSGSRSGESQSLVDADFSDPDKVPGGEISGHLVEQNTAGAVIETADGMQHKISGAGLGDKVLEAGAKAGDQVTIARDAKGWKAKASKGQSNYRSGVPENTLKGNNDD